ncbi:unnamed protein product [Phytophthora lilii]|uniref:Unnamed protein product n=1 Tax=Phytophthora lilii TaxID=2077276 RepID=A0A9W6U7H2_9STRA|nr:unnamed protein product [Phytophthora lilii]
MFIVSTSSCVGTNLTSSSDKPTRRTGAPCSACRNTDSSCLWINTKISSKWSALGDGGLGAAGSVPRGCPPARGGDNLQLLGPSPYLTLSDACARCSTQLLDWMWQAAARAVEAAARDGNLPMLQFLLANDAGQDVNVGKKRKVQTIDGGVEGQKVTGNVVHWRKNAMHAAIIHGKAAVMRWLLEHNPIGEAGYGVTWWWTQCHTVMDAAGQSDGSICSSGCNPITRKK